MAEEETNLITEMLRENLDKIMYKTEINTQWNFDIREWESTILKINYVLGFNRIHYNVNVYSTGCNAI